MILTNLATLQEALIAPESVSSDPKKLKEQLKNLSEVRTNLEDTGAEIDKIKANAEQMLKSNPHDRIYYFRTIYCQFMILFIYYY